MENKLAFSLGKTFGEIDKKIKNIENLELAKKDELITLFSILADYLYKSGQENHVAIIQKKIEALSRLKEEDTFVKNAEELYAYIKNIMQNIYFELKYKK